MEKQDEILKKREDEIKLINSELEKMTDKYQSLLASSGDSGREIRELNKKFTKLETDKIQLEKDNKTLKQNIEKIEKDLKTRDTENSPSVKNFYIKSYIFQGVQAPPTPPNPPPVIKLEPTFEEEDEDISDHAQLDATPTVAAKALRKGRKRGSANATESEPLVPKTRRRGRQAATKIKNEPVDEDCVLTPLDLEEIKEEDNEEETGGKRPGRRAKQTAKNKLGDSAMGSPLTRSAKKSESLENIVPDTPETETKPRGGRKKRILYNTDEIHITPPFECGNFVPSSVSNEQRTSSRLRGRKQSAV
ncbi:hypothetical protein LOTGIDRAFT_176426 [Lottia gigantea]|uniref:Uncharacterized protein n=1 Tax=Lottia gigantea TaxID=225164 RepID=V4CIA9_LOTGI|nr:hypothetical protein LOTGIDRAFT_176426 [Lottia gigantea]ESP01885.1 hypothetical protein LOTGIDRAFT_176426 [Lottia gigantea]